MYIGQPPFQEYTTIPTKDNFTGDGSTVAFDLENEVPGASENALEVYVDNVRQEPGSGKAFTLGSDGSNDRKRITFSAAPANGAAIYVINDKTNTTLLTPLGTDLNGSELILDPDGDTSITADSDDRIDFKIADTDHFHIGTSSGDTVFQIKTDAKDFLFNQYDGRTILDINDGGYVAIANGATGPGQLRLYEDTDNGTNFTAFQVGTQSADITYTLPTADGISGYYLSTNASGTLSWANPSQQATFVATTAFVPDASDGATLGTASLEFSDLFLADGATIQFGDDQEVALTHVADTGLKLNAAMQLQFNDASQYINAPNATTLDINATDEIELNATLVDVNANLDVSGTITSGGVITGTAFTAGSAVLTEAELETLDGITAGTVLASKAIITDANKDITGGRNITISGELDGGSLDIAGDADIDGTTNLDAVDIDGAVQIDGATTFGVNDTGVDVKFFGATDGAYLLWDESADKLLTAGATVIDVVKDKLLIGGTAVTTTAAELNLLDTAAANSVVNSKAVIYGSSGEVAGTLSTAAQTNITSVGTLTALTVDDVAVNGKVITMTGSSSDTAVFTAGANGTLSIVTTDDAAAAANITITADGTAELAGTTVTLNSSGGVTLDADNGTITFADAGSSLGTITSSGYSGTAAVATTVTITDNESTNENNAIVFTAGGDLDGGNLGLEADGTLNYNPSTGTLTCTNLVTSGTHTVTNSVEMTANSTVVFEGATADAHETTLGAIDATGDRAINLPNVAGTLPVLAAVSATAITSTPEELNILDGATVVVGEINALDLGSTAVGTAIASKAVILDSNKDYTGIRNFTTTGTVEAGGKITADAGIDIDNFNIDGTTIALSSGDMVLDSAADIILDAGGADVVFKDDGTQIGLFTMDSSNLTLQSSVSDKDLIFKGNDGGSTITALTLDMSASGQATFNNDVFSAGKFGLNDGDYINHVDNTRKEFVVNGNEEMRLEADGDLHVDNDVIAFSSTISDERLKTDITVVENALDKVEQIRGVEFTRTHNDSRSAGVIAQEVEKILPCAVIEKKLPLQTGDEDTLYKTVHYDALHALMIESIKELSSKVKELEKKLEEK